MVTKKRKESLYMKKTKEQRQKTLAGRKSAAAKKITRKK